MQRLIFLMISLLTVVRLYLTAVLICTSCCLVILSTFSCTCWPVVCLLWENVYLGPLSIFFIILPPPPLNWMITCILDINLLSDLWFANIFSHSMGCLFIFKIVACAEGFKFDVVFSTISAFGVKSKKLLPRLMSRNLLLIFSSRNFMVWVSCPNI